MVSYRLNKRLCTQKRKVKSDILWKILTFGLHMHMDTHILYKEIETERESREDGQMLGVSNVSLGKATMTNSCFYDSVPVGVCPWPGPTYSHVNEAF